MNLREAEFSKDSSQIAELLKITFKDTKFDDDFFLWKHFYNPMGTSFVLIAEENYKIIGVRCFMRWEISHNGKIYKALRPVDTAVHPNAQGKGLFTKMTMHGIEKLKEEYDLIFNTANIKCLDGYLKMGWKKISKPVFIYLNLCSFFSKKLPFINSKNAEDIPVTNESLFLKWRYSLKKYEWAIFEDGAIIVYRKEIKKGVGFMVLVDFFYTKADLSIYVNSICAKSQYLFYMFHKNRTTASLKSYVSIKMKEIVVVSRNDKFNVLDDYDFSLGDLEGTI